MTEERLKEIEEMRKDDAIVAELIEYIRSFKKGIRNLEKYCQDTENDFLRLYDPLRLKERIHGSWRDGSDEDD